MAQSKWSSLLKSAVTTTAVVALAAGTVLAEPRDREDSKTKVEQKTKITRDAAAEPRTSGTQTFSTQGELPREYRQLDLDQQQQAKIQQALTRHDSQLQQTWNQFHRVHMQTVGLEAAWVAALESQMTEEQRDQFREARQQQTSSQTTRGYRPAAEGASASDRTTGTDRAKTDRTGKTPKAANSRTKTEDREATDNRTTTENREGKRDRTGVKSDRTAEGHHAHGDDVTTYGIVVFAPEKLIDRKQMTPDKQEQCDRICTAYRQQIMSNWKQLHQLHGQLVQAEAKKFAAIDEVLTERQLEQLKTQRTQPKFESSRETGTDPGFSSERNPDSENPRKPRSNESDND